MKGVTARFCYEVFRLRHHSLVVDSSVEVTLLLVLLYGELLNIMVSVELFERFLVVCNDE